MLGAFAHLHILMTGGAFSDDGFGDFVLENLENIDVTLTGGFGCQIASFGLGFFIDTLAGFFADAFEDQAIDGLCKA